MLLPPLHYGLVERGLSRSELPKPFNYPFMNTLKVKTMIYVQPEGDHDEEVQTLDKQIVQYIADNRISLIELGGLSKSLSATGVSNINQIIGTEISNSTSNLTASNDSSPLALIRSGSQATAEDVVIAALTLLLDPQNYPIHLTCSSSSRHRMGVVVACFRKLQRWSISSIFAELRRYAGGERGSEDESNNEVMLNEQFIELFDVELVAHTLAQKQIHKHLRSINVAIPNQNKDNTGGKDNDKMEGGLASQKKTKSVVTTVAHKPTMAPQQQQLPVSALQTASVSVPSSSFSSSAITTEISLPLVGVAVSHSVDSSTAAVK